MSKQFEASPGAGFNDEQANIYGQRIHTLSQRVGVVTPHDVVNDARSEDSPYHDRFEWDDAKAGDKYRIIQARHLINHIVEVKIVRNKCEPRRVKVRSIVNVIDRGQQGYVPLHKAMKTKALRDQVVARALNELRGWRERYAIYDELAKIHEALDEVIPDE